MFQISIAAAEKDTTFLFSVKTKHFSVSIFQFLPSLPRSLRPTAPVQYSHHLFFWEISCCIFVFLSLSPPLLGGGMLRLSIMGTEFFLLLLQHILAAAANEKRKRITTIHFPIPRDRFFLFGKKFGRLSVNPLPLLKIMHS